MRKTSRGRWERRSRTDGLCVLSRRKRLYRADRCYHTSLQHRTVGLPSRQRILSGLRMRQPRARGVKKLEGIAQPSERRTESLTYFLTGGCDIDHHHVRPQVRQWSGEIGDRTKTVDEQFAVVSGKPVILSCTESCIMLSSGKITRSWPRDVVERSDHARKRSPSDPTTGG